LPPPNLSEGIDAVNQFIAQLVAGGLTGNGGQGIGDLARGGSHLLCVASATKLAHQATGNRRLTGVIIDGTNTVVSTSGVTFNTINGATSYSDATVIAIRGNATTDHATLWPCNIELLFAEDSNLKLYVDNGGAAVARVSLYWDFI
jgi:hypothetical protein